MAAATTGGVDARRARPASLLLVAITTERIRRLENRVTWNKNPFLRATRHGTVRHLSPARGGAAQSRRSTEGDIQQRQFLQHRHGCKGCHPDLQRRRGAHAGLHGRRSSEQDHAGRYFRSVRKDGGRFPAVVSVTCDAIEMNEPDIHSD